MAEENLLQTKLFTPQPRRNLVERSRLLAKLNNGISPEVHLILVSAPAGFGKTTLVSEWLRELPAISSGDKYAYTWLTLDEDDNNPIRFWRYMDATLQMIDPRIGESIRPALSAPQAAPYRWLVTGIVDGILEVDARFILVLDDYHLVNDETIHAGVSYLIDHLPPSVKLLIITRADPPLQLARRRSRGELCEIRAGDLRFSFEEVAQLVNIVMSLNLSIEDITALEKHTEGWIAGLQMAAISMQDVADPHGFVMAFRGNDRYIADYLVEEVLQRQPVEFQQFLLQTSILNQLSGPLCDAITGRSDSQSVLNNLERANLFLIPLDNRREWFRYHQLFASLLYTRLLDSQGASAVNALKQHAGKWYAAHGFVAEAVEILLASGDYEQAAQVIEQAANDLFMANELNLLVKWSSMLPEALVASRLSLIMMAAWGSQAAGYPQQAEHFLTLFEKTIGMTAEEFLSQAPPPRILTSQQRSAMIESIVLRSRLAIDTLDLDTGFSLGERVLPYLVPGPEGEARAFNLPYMYYGPQLLILGIIHKFRGNLSAASDLMIQAEHEAQKVNNLHIIALALGHLGEIQTLQGELKQGRATFERALRHANVYLPSSSAFWGMSSVGLGNLAYEWNDLVEAESQLKTGLDLGRLWHLWECLLPGCLGQALVHQAYGEWEQAAAVLDELVELASLNIHTVESAVAASRALLSFRQGDLESATQWASTFDIDTHTPYTLQWEQNALIAGRIWLENESTLVKAETLFTKLLSDAKSMGHVRTIIEIYKLQALLAKQQKQTQEAIHALLEALKLAASEGYMRLFLDEREPLRVLLESCLSSIHEPLLLAYAEHLLEAFIQGAEKRPAPVSRTIQPNQAKLIEPLSDRELEVLHLMAQGLSNPEIAKRLFLSTNTLKAHAQNIYIKLDVHNRMEAVNKARELGLLGFS
jgi:LuxR family maltose regulon positive regulatory protein